MWNFSEESLSTSAQLLFPNCVLPIIPEDGDEEKKDERLENLRLKDRSNEFGDQELLRKKESEVAQLCPTLCNPMDCSLPGSSVHGIFQARILEWVAICLSRGSSQLRD